MVLGPLLVLGVVLHFREVLGRGSVLVVVLVVLLLVALRTVLKALESIQFEKKRLFTTLLSSCTKNRKEWYKTSKKLKLKCSCKFIFGFYREIGLHIETWSIALT